MMKRTFLLLTLFSFLFFNNSAIAQDACNVDVTYAWSTCDDQPSDCPQCFCIRQVVNGQTLPIGDPNGVVDFFWPVVWTSNGNPIPGSTTCLVNLQNFNGTQVVVTFTPIINGMPCEEVTLNAPAIGCGVAEPPIIAGEFLSEFGDPIELIDVNVSQINPVQPACNLTVNLNGQYTCTNVMNGASYQITPTKDINVLNGVTTFDLVLISQHILGTVPFNSPFDFIAADANGSNTITGLDIVQIQQVILFITNDFPNNVPSWRFVPTSHNLTFTDPFNFPASRFVFNLNGPELAEDFTAVKIGDLNGTAIPSQFVDPTSGPIHEYNARTTFDLFLPQTKLTKGEEKTIPVRLSDLGDLSAYQFALDFNTEYLEITDWKKGDLPFFDKDKSALAEGIFKTLWFQENTIERNSIKDNPILFNLTVKAKKDISAISDYLFLSETFADAAFDQQGNASAIALNYQQLAANSQGLDFHIYPNPVNEALSLSFADHTPQGSLELFNTKGDLVFSAASVTNQIDMSQFSKGMYYLRYTTKAGSSVQKVVKQ